MKNNKQNNMVKEEPYEQAPDEDFDEEDEEIEEEIEEEVEEDEEEEMEDAESGGAGQKSASQGTQSSSGQNANSTGNNSQQQASSGGNQAADKRPRLVDELFEINLRRKKEHVGSALYIPFPRKVTEEEVRSFVGQGPNIFLVGPQKQNAIVRYRTQAECEKQQKELAKKEFDGQTLNIEPKTVKIDPANIDVKTLIIQYSNPDLSILDFATVFLKAISISLKGGKNKKESQEDLSFGSAIIIFPSHDEAKEAFLATENLTIKDEKLRVVFADFRPTNSTPRSGSSGGSGFRNKGGDQNPRFNRGNQGGGGGGGRSGGGGFRNRNRNSNSSGGGGGGGGGGNRNFGNRNFNSISGGGNNGGGGGGGGGNFGGQGRNYSPHKKFRSNVR